MLARLPYAHGMREQGGQNPVEMIMAQGMMANLSTPAFLVDRAGNLVFFNSSAARLLGVSYEEAGALPVDDWSSRFSPTTEDGEPLAPGERPLAIAAAEDGRLIRRWGLWAPMASPE